MQAWKAPESGIPQEIESATETSARGFGVIGWALHEQRSSMPCLHSLTEGLRCSVDSKGPCNPQRMQLHMKRRVPTEKTTGRLPALAGNPKHARHQLIIAPAKKTVPLNKPKNSPLRGYLLQGSYRKTITSLHESSNLREQQLPWESRKNNKPW